MSELGVALIAAGAALAGGAITGWYAHRAGRQQADAARHAGDRQADALLESVRIQADATLAAVRLQIEDAQHERRYARRRRCYGQFIDAVDAWAAGAGSGAEAERAFGAVAFEGPDEVTESAREIMRLVRGGRSAPARVDDAKARFTAAARTALERLGG